MHQTRKGKQWHFGTKLHVGLGSQSGLAHSALLRRRTKHMFAVAKRLWGYTKGTITDSRRTPTALSACRVCWLKVLNEIRFHGEITIEVLVEL